MKKTFYPELDCIKGIAILLVLLGHSFIVYPVNMQDTAWCANTIRIISKINLPIFFIVSGFLFSKSSNANNYSYLITQKIKRLLVPFFTYECLNLILKILFPALVNRKLDDIGTYLESLLLHGGDLWFVYTLFLVFAIWGWLLPKLKRQTYIWLSVLILWLLNQFQLQLPNDLFLSSNWIYFSIFFLLGYSMQNQIESFLNEKAGLHKWLYITILTTFFILNIAFDKEVEAFGKIIYLQTFIGSVAIMLIAKLSSKYKIGKFLQYIGKYSLPFYFFNGFALVPARTFALKMIGTSNLFTLLVFIFLLNLALEIIMVETVKRIPHIRILFGFRN